MSTPVIPDCFKGATIFPNPPNRRRGADDVAWTTWDELQWFAGAVFDPFAACVEGRLDGLIEWEDVGDDSGGGGGGTGTPLIIQDEGIALPTEPALNFIGTGVTAVDTPGSTRTNVTIPGLAATPYAGGPIDPVNLISAGVGLRLDKIGTDEARLAQMYSEGLESARPSAGVGNGWTYIATDTGAVFRSDGTTWRRIGQPGTYTTYTPTITAYSGSSGHTDPTFGVRVPFGSFARWGNFVHCAGQILNLTMTGFNRGVGIWNISLPSAAPANGSGSNYLIGNVIFWNSILGPKFAQFSAAINTSVDGGTGQKFSIIWSTVYPIGAPKFFDDTTAWTFQNQDNIAWNLFYGTAAA